MESGSISCTVCWVHLCSPPPHVSCRTRSDLEWEFPVVLGQMVHGFRHLCSVIADLNGCYRCYWIQVPLLRRLIMSSIMPLTYEVLSSPCVCSYCNSWSRLWYVFVLLEMQEGDGCAKMNQGWSLAYSSWLSWLVMVILILSDLLSWTFGVGLKLDFIGEHLRSAFG